MKHEDLKTPRLQKIASDLIARAFPWELSSGARAELVTSIVRQWRTYQGHAALLTIECRYWFEMSSKSEDQIDVRVSETPGHPLQLFLHDWNVDPDQSPEIIQRLNLSQSAQFANRAGTQLRMSVDPKERSLSIELVRGTATEDAESEVR